MTKKKSDSTPGNEAPKSGPESTPAGAPTDAAAVAPAVLDDLRQAVKSEESTQELPLEFGPVMLGDMVLYVMPNGKERPAIVVQVWRELQGPHEGLPIEEGICNLQVFTDGSNDQDPTQSSGFNERAASGLLWATSVRYSANHESGTWHWIDYA